MSALSKRHAEPASPAAASETGPSIAPAAVESNAVVATAASAQAPEGEAASVLSAFEEEQGSALDSAAPPAADQEAGPDGPPAEPAADTANKAADGDGEDQAEEEGEGEEVLEEGQELVEAGSAEGVAEGGGEAGSDGLELLSEIEEVLPEPSRAADFAERTVEDLTGGVSETSGQALSALGDANANELLDTWAEAGTNLGSDIADDFDTWMDSVPQIPAALSTDVMDAAPEFAPPDPVKDAVGWVTDVVPDEADLSPANIIENSEGGEMVVSMAAEPAFELVEELDPGTRFTEIGQAGEDALGTAQDALWDAVSSMPGADLVEGVDLDEGFDLDGIEAPEMVSSTASEILDGVEGGSELLGDGFGEGMDSAGAALDDATSLFDDGRAEVMDGLETGVTEATAAAQAAQEALVEDGWGTIQDAQTDALDFGQDSLDTVKGALLDQQIVTHESLTDAVGGGRQTIHGLWDGAAETAEGLFADAEGEAASIRDFFEDLIDDLDGIPFIGSVIDRLVDEMVDKVCGLFDDVQGEITDGFDSVWAEATALVDDVRSVAEEGYAAFDEVVVDSVETFATETVPSVAEDVAELAEDVATDVGEGVEGVGSDLIDEVENQVDNARDGINEGVDLFNDGLDAAGELADDALEGASNLAGDVADGAMDLAGDVSELAQEAMAVLGDIGLAVLAVSWFNATRAPATARAVAESLFQLNGLAALEPIVAHAKGAGKAAEDRDYDPHISDFRWETDKEEPAAEGATSTASPDSSGRAALMGEPIPEAEEEVPHSQQVLETSTGANDTFNGAVSPAAIPIIETATEVMGESSVMMFAEMMRFHPVRMAVAAIFS